MCTPGYKCLGKTLLKVRMNKIDDSEMNFGSYPDVNICTLQRPQVEELNLSLAMMAMWLVKK